MSKISIVLISILCNLFLIISYSFAQNGRIEGFVFDSQYNDPLPGANVYIEGTSYGAATDLNGKYSIIGIPAGDYQLKVVYIGYVDKVINVIVQDEQTLEQIITLDFQSIEGEVIEVTAQAEGQMQAMNQQLSAKTIKNIVSRKQIQDLPEANAAEAVGRLPGVSLERSGGEGNKVLIRGMASKYSLIQIDGVNMAATGKNDFYGADDRSTDLSMISSYMLEGIELTKSIMANQEATATGGIVNFKIKKAPNFPTLNVMTQGGMNDLHDTYKDYKLSVGGSDRFFDNRLGVFAQVGYEEKDNSSQQFGQVGYNLQHLPEVLITENMQLMEIFRDVQRTGGALVLDYTLPSTDIKSSNFISRIKREETNYRNKFDVFQNVFSVDFDDTPKSWLTIITNSLQIDHRWRNWEINTVLSHSYSENELPLKITSSNGGSTISKPFPIPTGNADFNWNLDPETIPDNMLFSANQAIREFKLNGIDHEESDTRERDLAGELNLAYTFNITDQVNVKLSIGGKVKHKTKKYDRTRFSFGNEDLYRIAYNNFDMSQRNIDLYATDIRSLYLDDFIDKDYDGGDFFDGKFTFSPIFDKEKYRQLHDLLLNQPDDQIYSLWSLYQPDFTGTNYYDYHGTEDYHAFYLMPEINIGPELLLVPGIRYEANRTKYTGYQGSRLGVLRGFTKTSIDTVTKVRENDFVLPMIQTFYKPIDWLTIKAGYTHTLQRPNYNQIMPGWLIGSQGNLDNLSNFRLKPELSRNWDLQFSFHTDKIGLLSIGVFHKKITDMIFDTGSKVILDTAYFELPAIVNRQRASWATNNDNPTYNYGYEFEWQSNFWYLPGLLKGLVINVNYTRNKSEAKYLLTRVITTIDPITYRATYSNNDTSYAAPMLLQPDHLLNLTLGYDYKGFSIRWAMRYKSHIYRDAAFHEKLRGFSTDFYRFDVQIRQKLPVDGLEFFLNANNLTGEIEHNVIDHLNFTSYKEDYGSNGNLGLRYEF